MFEIKLLSFLFCTQTRGRTGMDVTPLVFETSASTDSAIWATAIPLNCDAKVVNSFYRAIDWTFFLRFSLLHYENPLCGNRKSA